MVRHLSKRGPKQRLTERRWLARGVAAGFAGAVLLATAASVLWLQPKAVSAQPRPLTIAAAADLEPLLQALLSEFESQTGIHPVAVYASSATLAAQIINGGPYDLFLSADLSFPEKVIAAGRGASAQPIPYARGALVLWARRDSPLLNPRGRDAANRRDPEESTAARSGGLTLRALRSPELHKLAVADAQHAPYGRAAMASLASLGLSAALKDKLAIAENIAQAAQFAESGNAQAGLISLTSALTPQLERVGIYILMPRSSYPPILQGAVVVKNAANRAEAQRFLDFLLSPPVRRQMAARGLESP